MKTGYISQLHRAAVGSLPPTLPLFIIPPRLLTHPLDSAQGKDEKGAKVATLFKAWDGSASRPLHGSAEAQGAIENLNQETDVETLQPYFPGLDRALTNDGESNF